MGFDIKRYKTTDFKDRTKAVPVPKLRRFFDDADDPVWVIRGLTGIECAKAKQEVTNNANLSSMLQAITSRIDSEKIKGLQEYIGITDSVPDDIVQRFSWLEHDVTMTWP